jgi:uncharacterized protein (DUF1778 family)
VAAVTVKSRRVEARVDPETDELITRAAQLTHESISSFVIRAARDEASRVLARADLTWMPAEQFDLVISSLDHADPAPGLVRATSRSRRYTSG